MNIIKQLIGALPSGGGGGGADNPADDSWTDDESDLSDLIDAIVAGRMSPADVSRYIGSYGR